MYNKQLNDQCTKKFQDYVSGKRVLLVGNAASMFSSENHGELVDSYDVVLRFGKGWPDPRDAAYLGTRKDVWFFGPGRAGVYHRFADTKWRIYTPSQLKVYENAMDFMIPGIMCNGTLQVYRDFFMTGTSDEVLALNKKVNGDLSNEARLSQGIQCVDWFVNKVKAQSSLTLIGFDFFGKTFEYNFDNSRAPNIPKHHHASSWHCPLNSKQYDGNPHALSSDGTESNEKKYILGLPGVEHIKMPDIDYEKLEQVLKRLRGSNSSFHRKHNTP